MKVKFSRCNSNNLANVPQIDGQLIFVKDTQEVYIDVGNVRNNITNFLSKTNTDEYTPTTDYHPATKKYVDQAVQQSQPDHIFKKQFQQSDWVINGQQFMLTIPQSEHALANPYIINMEMIDSEDYYSVSMYGSKLLPNGNIIILSDIKYAGRIFLKGGI